MFMVYFCINFIFHLNKLQLQGIYRLNGHDTIMHQEQRAKCVNRIYLLGREERTGCLVCLKVFGYEIVIQFVNL